MVHNATRQGRPRGRDLYGRAMHLRPARRGEAAALSALALSAKAHWGYDAAFLARARPDLEVSEAELARLGVWVAEEGSALLGFSALDAQSDPPELVALFVAPAAMRRGAGGALLARALAAAADAGIGEVVIESDPNAEPFYLAQGARRIGERRAGTTGRTLPLLAITPRAAGAPAPPAAPA